MKITFAAASDEISQLRSRVREIEDFPRKGIWTQDVTPLFQDPKLFRLVILELGKVVKDIEFDVICGIESRGFMFGPPLAASLGKEFFPIYKTTGSAKANIAAYEYEYGRDVLEIHDGAIRKGAKALLLDDQVATGGTMLAAINLIEGIGVSVAGCVFILTQTRYEGLGRLERYPIFSLFEKNPTH